MVSEVFPPAIGGSGALLENVYRRIRDRHVRVLAHDVPSGAAPYGGPLDVQRVSMMAPNWGVIHPSALTRHVRVARAIRRALDCEPAVVHCARALPEGLSAGLALASRAGGYVCWLHGEELGYASTSRELTWLARRIYRGASAVIANSRNSKQLLVRDFGVPDSRVHVVYPGVDTERFRPDVDGRALRLRVASDHDLVFLSVGRLERRKGHDLVLRALAKLRQTIPRVRYVIVGTGPNQAQLVADASALGVADIVHFEGAATDADLPLWYAAADVFVMPNRCDGVDFEGFGIVFLEAAAAARPAIGGGSGGVVEAIEHDRTGLLVSGTDTDELVAAMRRMALSREERVRIGRAARDRVLKSFTWESAVNTLSTTLLATR